MTTPHEDVIIDLLPLYFGDEASAASRELVEDYFAGHPVFARTMRETLQVTPGVPAPALENNARTALKRVKTGLRWQAALIAVGIFFSLLPLSFMYRFGKLEYLMLRDEPMQAAIFVCIAAADWIALWLLLRRMNTPQP